MSKAHKNVQLTPENYIKTKARTLPIGKCYINDDWEASGMANIIIVRKHTNSNITVGIYLVDIMCLGIKDSFYYFNRLADDIYKWLSSGNFKTIDYDSVHNIIYGALAFANDYGFSPVKEWKVTQYILEEDDDNIPLIEMEFGRNGTPVYMPGPNDDQNTINSVVNTLTRTAGIGNFELMSPIDEWDEEEPDETFPFEPGELEQINSGKIQPDIYQYYYLTKKLYEETVPKPEVLVKEDIQNSDLVNANFFHSYVEDEEVEMDIINEIYDLIGTENALDGIKDILGDFPDNPLVLTEYYSELLSKEKRVPNELSKKLETEFPDYLLFPFTKAYYMMLQNDETDEAYALLGSSLTLEKAFPHRTEFSNQEWILFNTCQAIYFSKKHKINLAICYAENIEFEAYHSNDTKPLAALLVLSGKMAVELRGETNSEL